MGLSEEAAMSTTQPDQPNATRFSAEISSDLRAIATPDEIATLRKVVSETSRGHAKWWYLPFVARIIESLQEHRQNG